MLIVRIFLFGLVLLVPGYGSNGIPNQGNDDTLTVLLPSTQGNKYGVPNHGVVLAYCKVDGQICSPSNFEWQEIPAASGTILTFSWHNGGGWSPLGGGVHWSDTLSGKPVSPYPDPADPAYPDQAAARDFDWVLSLQDAVGPGHRVVAKPCLTNPSYCKFTAGVEFAAGVARTCALATYPVDCSDSKKGMGVPELGFVSSDNHSSRAAASYVVLELHRPLSEADGLLIQGLAGGQRVITRTSPNGADVHLDIALANLPVPPPIQPPCSSVATHFQILYDLVDINPPVPGGHAPVPAVTSFAMRDPGSLELKCEIPDFLEASKIAARLCPPGQICPSNITVDRTICPVGTP